MKILRAVPKNEIGISPALTGLAVVSISRGEHHYGLFRVKQVERQSLLLYPGAYSFQIGCQVDVEAFQYQVPNASSFNSRVTVVANNHDGIRMTW